MSDLRICSDPRDLLCSSERWDRTSTWGGNKVAALVNGEQAYPAMMEAIAQAQDHIFMCIYQFDDDCVGSRFAGLLYEATQRGVEVRVILDSWGALKSHPSIRTRLRGSGVEVKACHSIWQLRKYNQRYHRKLVLTDGEVGFTGGMNIRDRHLVESFSGNPMRDTVFQIEGPVLEMLEAMFIADWRYCGGQGDYESRRKGGNAGTEDLTVLGAGPPFRRAGLLDALTSAIERASVHVVAVTPFFLPDGKLLQAFACAARNGVAVDLILPTGDYDFLGWCAADYLQYLIGCGCSVYFSPPPYDHSKILIVDQTVFIGTVNLDYRSLHFNWEVAMACSGGSLVSEVERLVVEQRTASTKVNSDDLRERFPKALARKFLMSTVGRLF